MSELQLLRLFISERLSVAAEEIFTAVIRTLREQQQDRDQHALHQEVRSHSRDEHQVFLCAQEQKSRQRSSPKKSPNNSREDQDHRGFLILEPGAIKQEEQEPCSSPRRPDQGGPEISTFDSEDGKSFTSSNHIKVERNSPLSIECLTLLPDCSEAQSNTWPGFGLQNGCRISKESNVNHTGRNQRTESLQPHSLASPNRETNRRGKSYFCGEEFSHSEALNVHTQIHSSEKLFICEVCGKTFRHGNSMVAHMRIHTEEKRHCCRICGKQFRHVGNLNVHLRIHTGEKPYSCSLCGKKFTRNYLRTKHMAVHTG